MLHYLGEEGFLRLARIARETTLKLMDGIGNIAGLFVLGNPPATVFAFGSKEMDVYQLAARLKGRGWYVDSQHRSPSLHVTVSPVHEKIVDPFLKDLKEAAADVSGTSSGDTSGMAALYGMMGTMIDRKMAKAIALQYLNDLYRLR
jgi:sphinganine-1-phosphate aldolase